MIEAVRFAPAPAWSAAIAARARAVVTLAAVAAVYFGAARFGLSLAMTTQQVSPIWPATGIALAAVLLLGNRTWPAIWTGAFLANLVENETATTAAGVAVGNTIEALAGAYLVLRLARGSLSLERVRSVLALLAAAALAPVVSATIGVSSLASGELVSWASFGSVWWVWWVGDALGAVIVAPLVLAWATAGRRRIHSRRWELVVLFAAVVVLGYVAFSGYLEGAAEPYEIKYAVFPLVIWAALRFTQAETTAVVVGVASFAVWGATHGRGPFVAASQDSSLILLGLFVGATAVTALVLGAATAERRRALAALRRSHAELESRVHARTAELAAANANLTRANDALCRRTVELAGKNEEVEEFVYAVSHDLRGPLVNVQGFAAELELSCGDLRRELEAVDLPPALRTRVRPIVEEEIETSLRSLGAGVSEFGRLIDALLQLSHCGRSDLAVEQVDVRAVIDSCLAALRGSVDASGATVVVQPSLPRAAGDATAIRQVFSNLIENAVKYLRPDRHGLIEIGGVEEGERCRYWIRDNGAGIPAGAQKRLFQVFQRFHPELASGYGMGLAIVKRIVERHGGQVWAESEEGIGSVFQLTLPAAVCEKRLG